MLRYRRIMLPILLLLITFTIYGCSLASDKSEAKYTAQVKLFYGSPGNERLASETATINYNNTKEKYLATLNALLAEPKNPKLVANIAKGTKVLDVSAEGKDLTVNLSKQFLSFGGSTGEIVAVGSLVNTLVQFPEVDRVKILVAGKELIGPSGMPRGFMTEFKSSFDTDKNIRNIVLYFGDQNANYVHPEQRQISVKPGVSEVDFIKIVLMELIAGPKTSSLYPTIPREASVRSVVREGDLVTVDFSAEMVSKHWGGAAGEAMTVNSLTATLTDLDGIKRALLTVEGQPMALEHMVIDKPLTRNPEMIKP